MSSFLKAWPVSCFRLGLAAVRDPEHPQARGCHSSVGAIRESWGCFASQRTEWGESQAKLPAHQMDSSRSHLGRRLRQVVGGCGCRGGIWAGEGGGRAGSPPPRTRRCDSYSSRLLINFPQGKAQHMGGDIGTP